MRRILARIICLALMFSALAVPMAISASGAGITLPAMLTVVSEEAFINDTSLTEIVIPEAVHTIDARAFSGCSGLRKVSIYSKDVQIAADAFDQCPNVTLYVYSGSTAEAYAKQHGINCELFDYNDSRPTYLKVKEMIGQFSASGTGLMGGDDRVIVKMNSAILPDISEYNPVTIVEDDRDTYFIQFGSDVDASACKSMLDGRSDCAWTEWDYVGYVDNRNEDSGSVSQAGIITWAGNDDPMGFGAYAPYVANHQSGSQMIAIIDTGVEDNPVYSSMLSSKSINMLDDGQGPFYSGRHHATHIAGIIHDCVGNTNVKILSIRAVDDEERTDSMLFGQSIAYAVDSGASIINISYLFPKSKYVEDEIRYAVSKGVKVVIAAGNENGSTSNVFPANANVDDLIVVSGLDDGNQLWYGTNTGTEVTYCAPASGINTSVGPVGQGTSFAAPMIASAYALVNLDITHTIRNMKDTCKTDISIGNKPQTQAIGNGMPQLHKLLHIKVIGISVTGAPSVLKVGESQNVAFSVTPTNASDRTISFSSSNTSALTITRGSGDRLVLKAVGKGKATVTLTANDGSGVFCQFEVRVVQPVTRLTITGDSFETDLQHTLPLGCVVEPSNADNTGVTWSSSNTSVATVSQSGLVTPVAEGETIIRVVAKDGYGAHAEKTVKVVDIPEPTAVSIIANGKTLSEDDTLELQPGKGLQLSVKVSPDKAPQTVTWSAMSVPSGVVTVDSTGYVKAEKSGTAFVTATSTVKGSVQKSIGVLVQVMPTKITLSGPGEVLVGSTITMTATVEPDNADNKNVIWTSSNNGVARVQNGVVTGVYGGECDIVATAEADNTVTARKHIVVKQTPTSISISGTTNIFINNDDPDHPAQNASQLTATVSPANAWDKSVTWSSSDESVATVDSNGIVTTVAPGSATITATSKVASGVYASVTVNVKNQWTSWTNWSEDPVSETNSRQVKSKKQYRSNTKTLRYGDWSGWSGWTDVRESTSDTKQEESATVWRWYRFVCPNCGAHMHVYDKCHTWAGGCGKYIGSQYCQICWLPVSSSGGVQNWEGTGRIMYGNNAHDRWFYWKDSSQGYPNGYSTTGYRYSTRSSWWDETGWSSWQDNPIEPVDTNNHKVEVQPRTLYSYRDKNTF